MIIKNKAIDYKDVLIIPHRSTLSSRSEVVLERTFKTRNGNSFSGVPIIAANMATGNPRMCKALSKYKMFTAIAKHHMKQWTTPDKGGSWVEDLDSDEDYMLLYGFYTMGIKNKEEYEFFENLYRYADNISRENIKILVDVANGYMQRLPRFIEKLRYNFQRNPIFVGNVCTPEMTQELILAGADGVKIGIGPGGHCRTRSVTGVGYPQLQAIIDCADAAHGLDGLVIADGGCREYGDVAKSFCANADMVMLGTMLAGTDECEGEIVSKYVHDGTYNKVTIPIKSDNPKYNGCRPPPLLEKEYCHYDPNIIEKKYKVFYGMSSDKAQEEFFGGVKNYRASEGAVSEIEYKGPVEIQVRNILGGLRSCGTYIGAKTIKQFGKCGSFVQI